MKLADNVLLEIVEIVRKGLIEGIDVSEALRELDLTTDTVSMTVPTLKLSDKYLAQRGRVF